MKANKHSIRPTLLTLASALYLFFSACDGNETKEESLPAGEPPAPKSDTAQVWVAPESAQQLVNPHPASTASIEKGKAIFVQYCVSCHGTDGKGEVPAGMAVKAANLLEKTPSQSDGSLHWKLLTGRNAMLKLSAYGISDEDSWHIINYIRTLTKA
jgi:mono/diheme cytochrome c family protein